MLFASKKIFLPGTDMGIPILDGFSIMELHQERALTEVYARVLVTINHLIIEELTGTGI